MERRRGEENGSTFNLIWIVSQFASITIPHEEREGKRGEERGDEGEENTGEYTQFDLDCLAIRLCYYSLAFISRYLCIAIKIC